MSDKNKDFKYEVYHPEAEGPTPKFSTWIDALWAQSQWNKEVPGHKARKIKNVLKVEEAEIHRGLRSND